MAATVFDIKNLACSYDQAKVVLKVDALSIPKGKLTFIVGVSGGGKSTLLETLGMMNKTIHLTSAADCIQFHSAAGEQVPLAEFWQRPDEELSTLRRENFSFIFQQTNLMPNFSAGENMLVTALLGGAATATAEELVRKLMHQIGLPARAYDAPIQNLSGGQRQRLAFIRALVSEFEVLFGDEPTGNLDHKTAHDCFTLLKSYIHENAKSGIIVSHD